MSFVLTRDWLSKYYGSKSVDQVADTKKWLLKYGKDVPPDKLEEWSYFKHLSEYQINTPDIVTRCLYAVGSTFISEISAHLFVNELRVPVASAAYLSFLKDIQPSSILELGVGGDSAISTAVFLDHIQFKDMPALVSVDINPLGMTLERYKEVPFWRFNQLDSCTALDIMVNNNYHMDMVFIDTIHSYEHTMKELNLACKITSSILMDDANFEGNDFDKEPGGVKRAIREWLALNAEWESRYIARIGESVCLITKR